jgi:hypothetical protein
MDGPYNTQQPIGETAPRLASPVSSPTSSVVGSPRCDQFLHLGGLHTKLSTLQSPLAPKLSPLADDTSSIETFRTSLARWGLSDFEINYAQHWDQKALHHTAESIRMRLLTECVACLSTQPAFRRLLYYAYGKNGRI